MFAFYGQEKLRNALWFKGHVIKPNPVFLKEVSEEDRGRWANALRKAHADDSIHQIRERMTEQRDGSTGMCCLMVGHVEFSGGKDAPDKRNDVRPIEQSEFTKAMGSNNPHISRSLLSSMSAAGLNDQEGLTFLQIADLLEGKEVELDYAPHW